MQQCETLLARGEALGLPTWPQADRIGLLLQTRRPKRQGLTSAHRQSRVRGCLQEGSWDGGTRDGPRQQQGSGVGQAGAAGPSHAAPAPPPAAERPPSSASFKAGGRADRGRERAPAGGPWCSLTWCPAVGSAEGGTLPYGSRAGSGVQQALEDQAEDQALPRCVSVGSNHKLVL